MVNYCLYSPSFPKDEHPKAKTSNKGTDTDEYYSCDLENSRQMPETGSGKVCMLLYIQEYLGNRRVENSADQQENTTVDYEKY